VDPELFERVISAYGQAIRILDPIRFQVWADSGLTMPQARVLFTLVEAGEQSAGELAERLGVTPSTITGITDRLVRQGLIQRKEDARDRRVVRLGLSAEGRSLTLEIAESSRSYLRRVLEQIPDNTLIGLADALEGLARANESLRAPLEVPS
jgi:DNA-binding MarR family transcriptional regulator